MMTLERRKPSQSKRQILSVPLSSEQRTELEARAGRQPVSAYARDRLFPANDNDEPAKPTRRRTLIKNAKLLAHALALLGPTSGALKQIMYGIAIGVLPVTPDTEAAMLKACHDIAKMKAMLMKPLGIREK